MEKTEKNLRLLMVIFVTSLVISNIVTTKLVSTGISFLNTEVILPGAMFCYALTFLVTDIIGEVWGKEEANDCVKLGFLCQIIAFVLIQLTKYLPTVDINLQNSYNIILGQNGIFVGASLLAYLAAQKWDVFIFHKIRNYYLKKLGNNKHRWIWNNVSTITSQFLDTIIFITIAFGWGYGWLFYNPLGLLWMILGQYLFKCILAILDTPVFYLLTKNQILRR